MANVIYHPPVDLSTSYHQSDYTVIKLSKLYSFNYIDYLFMNFKSVAAIRVPINGIL